MTPRASTGALVCIGVGALLLSACAGAGSGNGDDASGVSVVATTTVWGDVARQVVTCAGSGQVTALMPIGADPHDFSASSEDVASMEAADLVIANGLGLEEGLEAALENARADGANILEIGPMLDPIPFGQGEGHSQDPHVWLDVARVATAAHLIGDELATRTGTAAFRDCGDALRAELTTLDGEVAATLATVPEDRRILVTDHDAFGYFARAYGYTVAGTVVPGGSTLGRPSSAELAELVATVRRSGVPAIFSNTANPQALVDALAVEVGEVEVVPLLVGSLGEPGSGADTFQGMMTTNAQRISAALAG